MRNEIKYNPKIPVDIQEKWQKILNLLVKIAGSSDALITRFDPPFLDIFKSSENPENIFDEGSRVKLSDHYCNIVIKNDKKVMIINALKDEKWRKYNEVQSGLIGYLGYPIKWPDGKIFGTLCIHYKEAHIISDQIQDIMFEFKELIESHLVIIDKNIEKEQDNEIINRKEKKYQELVSEAPIGIFETTAKGKIISINKRMAEILGFSSKDELLEYYNDLREDLYVNHKRRDEFIKILSDNSEVKNFVYEALGKNKEHMWINMNARKEKLVSDSDFIIQGFAFDITEKKEKDKKFREQKKELTISFEKLTVYNEEIIAMNEELEESFEEINTLNKKFVHMIDLISNMGDKTLLNEKEFFSDLLKNAIEIIPEADYGKICLINANEQFEFIDAVGHNINILKKIKLDKELLINRESRFVNNTKDYFFNIDEIETNRKELLEALKPIKDSLYINISIDGQTIGRIGLDIKEKSNNKFSDTTKKVLESYATLASSFFAFKRFDDLQSNFTKELITSIIKIMEMYDLYTKGHSENVASLASAIAKGMNLSKKTIKDTYWAGLVHDIGKLLVPIHIINKKEKLTETEFELIKKHPIWGNKALSHSKMLKPIANYILYHHERWDGKGYPEGLEANRIPLISQIICVADAWDAMLSKRAYRDSLSFEQAFEEIKRNKGTQFSPKVVEAFIKIIINDRMEILKKDILDNEINNITSEKHPLVEDTRYENLFQEFNEGIAILDEKFNIVKANRYFINMFGYDMKDIIGSNIKKIVPKIKFKETEKFINKLSHGEKINSRTTRTKANGENINVAIQGFPFSLDVSNLGYYVIYRDISELEETKRKYEDINDRYRILFENADVVMLVIDPETGEIIDANFAAEKFYGWSQNELKRKNISELNTLTKEEIEVEMKKAKSKKRKRFIFKHRLATNEIKEVEVYSQPIKYGNKDYLYSIIHDRYFS